MGLARRLGLIGLLAVGLPGAASAADMAEYAPAPEVWSGWYFRADIGFSNQRVGSLYNILYEGTDVTNVFKDFSAAPFGGFGIGYQVNNWFRLDITGEYRGKSNFDGLDTYTYDDGGPIVTRVDDYDGNKSEWTFLANAYFDIWDFHGFKPFIGVGLGTSYNIISDFTDVDPTDGDTFDPSYAYAKDTGTWNFAWAVYAGIGYQVTERLTIEAAYRYLDLGKAQSGDLIAYDGTNNYNNPMHFNNLTSHDFKVGFRFALN
jgi:opacity protein-like surface antigen